ncbi:MAG: class I SAM-dependent methyltransferase [Bacilli bacterium]|nr:class I SAM-dependent methyltransferase [Bacilli bacterium]MDD4282679.1 class I SAM-dependent methyltransferase [Bacilli bacterium]
MYKLVNKTNKFMDSIAFFYDVICKPCTKERVLFLESILKDNNINCFLDLSCSTGETIYHLADDKKVIFCGIDFSHNMIKVAKKKNFSNKNTSFYKLDMNNLIRLNSKYDLIYSNSLNWNPTFEYIDKTFDQIKKVITKDGILIIDIPNPKKLLTSEYPIYTNSVANETAVIIKITQYLNRDIKTSNKILKMYQSYNIVNLKSMKQKTISHIMNLLYLEIETLKRIADRNGFYIIDISYEYDTLDEIDCNTIQIMFKQVHDA